MKTIKLYLGLSTVLLILILSACNKNQTFEKVEDLVAASANNIEFITVEELKVKIDSMDIFNLIDVREPQEFYHGYIPGSASIPRGLLEFKIANEDFWMNEGLYLPEKDELFIIICKKGSRSVLAAESIDKVSGKLGFEFAPRKTKKKDDEEETPEEPNVQFETLMTYMGANGMDITDILGNSTDGTKWVKAGSKVVDSADYSVPNFYVIDLRKAEDFELGHIKDAHNTTLGNILDEAANATKSKILVVCYSGQTSARATAALRLSGYPETYSLKWGMAGWNDEFNASWVGGAEPGIYP